MPAFFGFPEAVRFTRLFLTADIQRPLRGNVKFPPDFQQKCGRWNPFLLLGLEELADFQRHSAQKLIVP
jgi:hypothetical protein